jgi:hypothetical protein
MIQKLRFKKLLNEYKSLEYEFEMVKEILKEEHLNFEVFYLQWCVVRDIDIKELNKKNHKKVETIFNKKQQEGLVKVDAPKKKESKHKDVYRSLAKKIHPDKLDTGDSNYWRDYMDFKDATSAMSDEKWGKLFEIADRQNIYLKDYESVCEDIEEDIENLRSAIEKEKCSYSWKLYQCKTEKCKDDLIKAFLFQLFGWRE